MFEVQSLTIRNNIVGNKKALQGNSKAWDLTGNYLNVKCTYSNVTVTIFEHTSAVTQTW